MTSGFSFCFNSKTNDFFSDWMKAQTDFDCAIFVLEWLVVANFRLIAVFRVSSRMSMPLTGRGRHIRTHTKVHSEREGELLCCVYVCARVSE